MIVQSSENNYNTLSLCFKYSRVIQLESDVKFHHTLFCQMSIWFIGDSILEIQDVLYIHNCKVQAFSHEVLFGEVIECYSKIF